MVKGKTEDKDRERGKQGEFPAFSLIKEQMGCSLIVVGTLGPGVPNKQHPNHIYWASATQNTNTKTSCLQPKEAEASQSLYIFSFGSHGQKADDSTLRLLLRSLMVYSSALH